MTDEKKEAKLRNAYFYAKVLENPDSAPGQLFYAARALVRSARGKTDVEKSVDALINASLNDKLPKNAREFCVEKLASLAHNGIEVEKIVPALTEEPANKKYIKDMAAAYARNEVSAKKTEAIAFLIKTVEADVEPKASTWVIGLLVDANCLKTAKPIIGALGSKFKEVREAAAHAFEKLAFDRIEVKKIVNALEEAKNYEKDERLRKVIVNALKKIKIEVTIKQLDDEDREKRGEAVMALGKMIREGIGDKREIVTALEERLMKEEDRGVLFAINTWALGKTNSSVKPPIGAVEMPKSEEMAKLPTTVKSDAGQLGRRLNPSGTKAAKPVRNKLINH